MRIKRNNNTCTAGLLRRNHGLPDHRAMPPMNTVENANGDNGLSKRRLKLANP